LPVGKQTSIAQELGGGIGEWELKTEKKLVAWKGGGRSLVDGVRWTSNKPQHKQRKELGLADGGGVASNHGRRRGAGGKKGSMERNSSEEDKPQQNGRNGGREMGLNLARIRVASSRSGTGAPD